ncbi:hypothetical protein D9M68_918230 [compost metagenome]
MGRVPHTRQAGVVEHLHGLGVAAIKGAFGLVILLGQAEPAEPADRGVERVEVEAHRLAVTLGRGSPFAGEQHLGLAVLFDQDAAGAAEVVDAAVILGVLEVPPLQHLELATVRARHEVAALVADLEQIVDA